MGRVFILGQTFYFFLAQRLRYCVDCFGKFWARLGNNAIPVTCHEGRSHDCAVVVCNLAIAYNMIYAVKGFFTRERRKRWGEQKERNPAINIKRANSSKDGERGIVKHYAPIWVVTALIVSTRPEWPHDAIRINSIFFAGPVPYNIVYRLRRHTIVRRFLRFEFLNELLVRLALQRTAHAFSVLLPASPISGPHTAWRRDRL